jgi:phage terminase large subunit-like protein
MYVSATTNLAEKQLKAIKDILTSKIYRRYWPEMTNPDEGKREKWTNSEIAVDHPKRSEEGVRDPTLWATGVGATQTGMHSDVIVYDDLVVPENAYTDEGRRQVAAKYSQMASVANPGSLKWVVGTRYHPRDIYKDLQEMQVGVYDKKGQFTGKSTPRYETFERQVEDQGDGQGEFIWPRQQRKDGVWFGFNPQVLDEIRNEYLDKSQFRAQYYNDPNDESSAPIKRDSWTYFDKKHLSKHGSYWFFNGRKLNIYAAVDFAFSRAKKADWTAIAVVGVDEDHNYFVLDIDRFKTDSIGEYFDAINHAWDKWQFKNLRLEVTVAQQAVVKELQALMKSEGMIVKIDEFRPNRHEGNKQERLQSILEPRYSNGQMYHYRGGNCQILEEELVMLNPPHDDCKDALAAALDLSKAPKKKRERAMQGRNVIQFNRRFGGISR